MERSRRKAEVEAGSERHPLMGGIFAFLLLLVYVS